MYHIKSDIRLGPRPDLASSRQRYGRDGLDEMPVTKLCVSRVLGAHCSDRWSTF